MLATEVERVLREGAAALPTLVVDAEAVRSQGPAPRGVQGHVRGAIGDLPARQRSLLALAIVKGLGVDRIGAIYGVHRATAARWVVAARQELTRAVRRALHVRLRVPDHEIGDMVPLVESQLELSLERILSSRPV